MKKLTVLVKKVLMSTLTAGIVALSFTACSEDDDMMGMSADTQAEQTINNEPLKAVGLMFNDFINQDDVQILKSDTSQISISRAFAEKKGIDNFVNRPMGIWINFRDQSFLCRGVAQHLVGDRYIVDVVEATIEDVLQPGCVATLKTEIFLNHAAVKQAQTRGGEAMEGSRMMESLLTDNEGFIHPAAISFPDADMTRSGINPNMNYSPMELLGLTNECAVQTRSWWDDILDGVVHTVESVFDPFGVNRKFINWVTEDDDETTGDFKNNLINYTGTQILTKKFKCGEGENDTIVVKGKLPMKIQVNYMLNLQVGGSLTSPRMDYFLASLDGELSTSPELTIGFSRALDIPEEMQKIKLHQFKDISVQFVVYGIPIDITFRPSLYFKLKAKTEGSLYTGVKYEFGSKFTAGAEYSSSQWKDLSDIALTKNQLSFIPPTAEFKFIGGLGVMLGCDIIFEKIAGPSIAAGPQLTLNLNMKVAPTSDNPITFTGNSKIGFLGEVGAKVSIWKWDVLDYFHDIDFGLSKTLWDYKYPDASNKKDDPITEVLDIATEYIKSMQDEVKSKM